MKRIKQIFAMALAVMMILTAMPATAEAAAKKPTMPTRKTITVGKSATLKISKNGWTITKVSAKSKKATVAKVTKATKTAVKFKGVKKGSSTITTTIKAKKGTKTKTYKLKTKITVIDDSTSEPEPTPAPTPIETTAASQAEIDAALADANLTKLTVESNGSSSLNLTGSHSNVELIVNAPNASITNNATWKSITIKAIAANTWHENAQGNKIYTDNATGIRIVLEKGASVDSVKVSSTATGNVKVEVVGGSVATIEVSGTNKVEIAASEDAKISKVDITGKADVDVKAEGSAEVKEVNVKTAGADLDVIANGIGKVNEVKVEAKADVTVGGTNKDNAVKVEVASEAGGTKVTASTKVDVANSATGTTVSLTSGAAGSTVKTETESATTTTENKTGSSVTVESASGTSTTVPSGQTGSTTGSGNTEVSGGGAAGGGQSSGGSSNEGNWTINTQNQWDAYMRSETSLNRKCTFEVMGDITINETLLAGWTVKVAEGTTVTIGGGAVLGGKIVNNGTLLTAAGITYSTDIVNNGKIKNTLITVASGNVAAGTTSDQGTAIATAINATDEFSGVTFNHPTWTDDYSIGVLWTAIGNATTRSLKKTVEYMDGRGNIIAIAQSTYDSIDKNPKIGYASWGANVQNTEWEMLEFSGSIKNASNAAKARVTITEATHPALSTAVIAKDGAALADGFDLTGLCTTADWTGAVILDQEVITRTVAD